MATPPVQSILTPASDPLLVSYATTPQTVKAGTGDVFIKETINVTQRRYYVKNEGSGYSGGQGEQGVPGVSGKSGWSGAAFVGSSGWSGKSGFSGWSGVPGVSGWSGVPGVSGWSGSGVSGWSGIQGVSGFSGSSEATSLKTSTGAVEIGSATAPDTGQILIATDSTHATWQTPSQGGISTGKAIAMAMIFGG